MFLLHLIQYKKIVAVPLAVLPSGMYDFTQGEYNFVCDLCPRENPRKVTKVNAAAGRTWKYEA